MKLFCVIDSANTVSIKRIKNFKDAFRSISSWGAQPHSPVVKSNYMIRCWNSHRCIKALMASASQSQNSKAYWIRIASIQLHFKPTSTTMLQLRC